MWKHHTYLILAAVLLATTTHAWAQDEASLLAVLRSDAGIQEKSAACRQLAQFATKEAVPTLAAMLGDEQLSHMARYAMETIPDPSVDEALRDALGKLQGRPRLGVIGSLGVRRDAAAVDALAALLRGTDAAQAAARALGCIGTPAAAQALQEALPATTGPDQKNVCEGLLRCAEAMSVEGHEAAAQAIYDHLHGAADLPLYIRAAGLRGAILIRGKDGAALVAQALEGPEYALAAMAVRAAMESPAPEITQTLADALPKASAERKGLLIVALADSGESQVLPAVLQAAQDGDDQLRIQAMRALRRMGDASCVSVLLAAATEENEEVARTALETLESLQDKAVEDQIAERLSQAQGQLRIVLLDLARRRRTAAATPALWQAADDADMAIRLAALAGLGAALDPAELPKLIERLNSTEGDQETAALDKALCEVALRAADREAVAGQLAAAMNSAGAAVKARILETLNTVSGTAALETVAAAARSRDAQLRDAAYRVLGRWNSADAGPVLLELHNAASDERLQTRAIRAYIRIARQFDMPAEDRAAMCRTALTTAQRDADKQLILEILLRYPSEQMQAIAEEAAKIPALKDQALMVIAGMSSDEVSRAELGRALAQAGQQTVQLEIVQAEYGAGEQVKDVTDMLRQRAKNYRIIFLPSTSYNESFGGDPAPDVQKKLTIKYQINGKDGEVVLNENAMIVLPMPK